MSKNFDFHLFLCLGSETLKKVIEDIDLILNEQHETKKMFPNYDFKSLEILKKRFLLYQNMYSDKLKNLKTVDIEYNELLKDINTLLDKHIN